MIRFGREKCYRCRAMCPELCKILLDHALRNRLPIPFSASALQASAFAFDVNNKKSEDSTVTTFYSFVYYVSFATE